MSCNARWFPRPSSTQALALTPGCTRCGVSSEVSSSRGEPTRSAGGGGHGPPVTSPTPASARTPMASPRWCAIISSMLTPQRSAAASTLPALVPTTRSTPASGHGRRSCRAGSAPVIQAAPSTPPAPSTTPPRRREPPGATSGPMSAARSGGPGRPRGARGGGGSPAPRPCRAGGPALCPRRGGGAAGGRRLGLELGQAAADAFGQDVDVGRRAVVGGYPEREAIEVGEDRDRDPYVVTDRHVRIRLGHLPAEDEQREAGTRHVGRHRLDQWLRELERGAGPQRE